jgi:hypothetical protein
VDLTASDRLARQLVFRPQAHDAAGDMPGVRELLLLDASDAAQPSLLRRLCAQDPLEADTSATLQAEGAPLASLLAWIDTVPPARQWQDVAGCRIALGHKLLPAARDKTEPVLTLLQAQTQVAGVALTMRVSRVKNVSAELELRPVSGTSAAPHHLPEDLLAVLGLDWSRLSRHSGGWRASLRLRGDGAARGLDAEAKFRHSVAHLAQVLAAQPAAFHPRFARERWRVVLRRGFPLVVCLGLIGAAAAVPLLELGPGSVFRMLIFNAPPLLLVWLFAMREMPRIELPPLPRPLAADSWSPPSATPA